MCKDYNCTIVSYFSLESVVYYLSGDCLCVWGVGFFPTALGTEAKTGAYQARDPTLKHIPSPPLTFDFETPS